MVIIRCFFIGYFSIVSKCENRKKENENLEIKNGRLNGEIQITAKNAKERKDSSGTKPSDLSDSGGLGLELRLRMPSIYKLSLKKKKAMSQP